MKIGAQIHRRHGDSFRKTLNLLQNFGCVISGECILIFKKSVRFSGLPSAHDGIKTQGDGIFYGDPDTLRDDGLTKAAFLGPAL